MKKVGVAILGLGAVGGGTYKILAGHREMYQRTRGVDIVVEAVLEVNKQRALSLGIEESRIASNISEICSNPEVDIVVECLDGVEPARSYDLAAMGVGKSVVTSNKELYCKYGYELEHTAKHYDVGLFFGATCVGGVPIIRSLSDGLQGNKISSLVGILNGPANYILTKMSEDGISYSEALSQAKSLGYVEADPSSDVEGLDSVYKLSILSSIAFNTKIPYTEIYREGITSLSVTDIKYGKRLGYVVKLLAIAKDTEKGIEARVHPSFLRTNHPLASVNGDYNAVYLTGDSAQDIMFYGKGAGEFPGASAVVGDLIFYAAQGRNNYSTFENTEKAASSTKFITDFHSAYYLRFAVNDKVGELSRLTAILGKYGISAAQVIQDAENSGKGHNMADIVIVTYPTHEVGIKRAVKAINRDLGETEVVTVVRVLS